MEGKTKGILVAVVKWRHRTNGLLQGVLKLFVLFLYSSQSMLEMQRIIVKCFWQYLSLSTHDTYVILYEIKVFYLVLDNLFSFFFTSLSKPQHLQKRKFNTEGFKLLFLQPSTRREKCKIMSLSCAPHLHAVTQIETRDCSQSMNVFFPLWKIPTLA